jgi:hypothetical protein
MLKVYMHDAGKLQEHNEGIFPGTQWRHPHITKPLCHTLRPGKQAHDLLLVMSAYMSAALLEEPSRLEDLKMKTKVMIRGLRERAVASAQSSVISF